MNSQPEWGSWARYQHKPLARVPEPQSEPVDADKLAKKEWLEKLAELWEIYDKPMDPKRFKIYRDRLSIVPLGLLEKVIDRVVRSHVYNSVPSVGTMFEALRKELSPYAPELDLDDAIMKWSNEQILIHDWR